MLQTAISGDSFSQTETDAIMMNKSQFCAGFMYGYSSWDQYWEGTLKRNNLNLGTVSTQSVAFMANYGISNNLNIMVAAPYIKTKATAGTLRGMRGVQDIALNLKWRAYTLKKGGNPASWKKLEDDCIARGEDPWYSLEVPKRPPMLPGFGKVKPFLFDSLTVIALRPGPPPSVASAKMKEELAEVNKYLKNPTRDQIRIVHYWADGVGTYTPPGHWDEIAAEDFIKKNFSEVRWARNMALLNMALMDAAIVCWDSKFHYFNPRPTQLDPSIKTATGIPNFPAYISGHSTFSGAAATTLAYIVPERSTEYHRMAIEASMSRVYGGIHYRSDCEIGVTVGNNVGEYAVERARTDGAD